MLKAISKFHSSVWTTVTSLLSTSQGEEKRIVALDFARFMAMLMMIQGHVVFALGDPATFDIGVFPWNIWNFLRGFTAPVFLIVSGAANVFANKRLDNGMLKPKVAYRRIRLAMIILFIGYLFAFPANRFIDVFFIEQKYWEPFFRVNILQLIAISLLMLVALFKLTKSDRQLGNWALAIAISITLLAPIFAYFQSFEQFPLFLYNYLSFDGGSLFPIFPYTAFLFYGVFFGVMLKTHGKANSTEYIFKKGGMLALGMLTVLIPAFILTRKYQFILELTEKVNPIFILMQVGGVLAGVALLSLLYLLTKNLSKYYQMFGKRALHIYVIHLVLIYGTPWFPSIGKIYPQEMGLMPTLFFAAVIQVVTLGSIYSYEMYSSKIPGVKTFSKVSLSAIVGFLITAGSPLLLF